MSYFEWETPVFPKESVDQQRGPFVAPRNLLRLYAKKGHLKGMTGQEARMLYSSLGYNFDQFRDLTTFGMYCNVGYYEGVLEEYEKTKPDSKHQETTYKWGYVSLAAAGSRHNRRITDTREPSPHAAIIRFLVEKGAPIDGEDIAGLTALQQVCQMNRVQEVLDTLLELGANPNHRDRYGCTPLHSAVMNGQTQAVEMLLKYGADPTIGDGDKITPNLLLRSSTPDIQAIFEKYKRRKAGARAPLEEKDKCAACGKANSKLQCSRCRVVRYCSSECQRADWKNVHKKACIAFGDKDASVVCNLTYLDAPTVSKSIGVQMARMTLSGRPDGEEMGRQDEGSSGTKSKLQSPKLDSPGFKPSQIGKSMLVKVQVPLSSDPAYDSDTLQSMLVYDRTRKFMATISPLGQKDVHEKLASVVKEKGYNGQKAYFTAELESEDRLRIKFGEVLGEQPW